MRADADSRLTAARQEPTGGCVVPNSQIEMVVKNVVNGRVVWQVCGRIERGSGRAVARKVGLYIVVRQGDVIARGDSREDFGRWVVQVTPDDGQLKFGPAIASAVAIVEKEDPTGLETLTWVQRVKVVESRGEPQDLPFPPSELTVTKEGEVADDRAVSSSLAILEEPRGPGGFQWEQELEIRKVVDLPE
jgi:hypothetical protein